MGRIKDHYKNPTPRQIAAPRQIAEPRTPITIPRTLSGKERYEPQNIGKLHVTLDTNVVIDALVALKKEGKANDRERASKKIIDYLVESKFLICLNSWLKEEYETITRKLIKEGKIRESDVTFVLKTIIGHSFFLRMAVVGSHIAQDFNDDHLFDGTLGDYLVTSDKDDVNTPKVVSQQKNFKKILNPQEFVKEFEDRQGN